METSVILFHGPNSNNICVSSAEKYGPQVCPPLGAEGLTRQEARDAVKLLMSPSVGGKASLVVGPLEDSTLGSTDVLLKILEEPYPSAPRLFLWTRDLGSVSFTIRSRCLHQWCPGVDAVSDLTDVATEMISSLLREEIASIVFMVLDAKGREEDLLRECVRLVSEKDFANLKVFSFWARARKLLRSEAKLTASQVVSCFLGDGL